MAVKNHRDMVNVEATMDKIARWEQLIPDFHMDWVNEANMAQEFNVELYREAMVEDEGDGFSPPQRKAGQRVPRRRSWGRQERRIRGLGGYR